MDRHRRRAAHAHLALELAEREARERRLDQERRHALVAAATIDRREERQHRGVGTVRHPHLRAVQHVAVAAAYGGRRHARGVRARARLGDRQRARDLARGEPRQVAAFLRLRSVRDERVAGGVLHEIDDGGGGTRPCDLFHREAEREGAEAGAAVRLGHVQAHEALRAEQSQLLGGIRFGLVHLRRQRRDALARQRTRELARLPLVVAQPERVAHAAIIAPLDGGSNRGPS